jgi:hypothetical protein
MIDNNTQGQSQPEHEKPFDPVDFHASALERMLRISMIKQPSCIIKAWLPH